MEKSTVEITLAKPKPFYQNKKLLLGLTAALILVTGIFIYRRATTAVSPLSSAQEKVAVTGQSEAKKQPGVILEDEWGFRVSYPQTLTARAATGAGELTRWEFTGADSDGKISIFSRKLDYQSLEEWLQKDPITKTSTSNLDSSLGGEFAKKLKFANSNKLWIAAIESNQLFVVEFVPGANKELEKAYQQMLATFQFLPFEGEKATTSQKQEDGPVGLGDEVIDEGEEVVE